MVSMDSDLLASYSISLTSEEREGGTARMIRLAGEATPNAYEIVSQAVSKVVHVLKYLNRKML